MKKENLIAEAILIAWDSLRSHLPYTYKSEKVVDKIWNGQSFHKKCVKDYAKLIEILTRLY